MALLITAVTLEAIVTVMVALLIHSAVLFISGILLLPITAILIGLLHA